MYVCYCLFLNFVHSLLKWKVGNLIFDPLLGEEESIYLGVRGEAWLDTPLPNSSGELRDLSNDTQWFSDLWGIWSSLLDQGLTT